MNRCLDCRWFRRWRDHPHLGQCLKGEPPPTCGLFWDTAVRGCGQWAKVAAEGRG